MVEHGGLGHFDAMPFEDLCQCSRLELTPDKVVVPYKDIIVARGEAGGEEPPREPPLELPLSKDDQTSPHPLPLGAGEEILHAHGIKRKEDNIEPVRARLTWGRMALCEACISGSVGLVDFRECVVD